MSNPIRYIDPTGLNSGDVLIRYAFTLLDRAAKVMKNGGDTVLKVCTGFIPLVGEGLDITEAATGKDWLTGEQLTPGERILTGGTALIPIVSGPIVRGISRTLKIDSVQFGKKVGKHAEDFGLNPSNVESRNFINDRINNIFDSPTEIRQGT